MLQKLTVKNYAIIDHIEIGFSDQLNIITGETGAGKSIILGALALILGQRADSKVMYQATDKCVVEGQFAISNYQLQHFFKKNDLDYESETIIRREISVSGKSRAFINDTPVTLDVLKELGAMLVNLHSQHETLALSSASFQLQLVDAVAKHDDLLANYRNAFAQYKQTAKQLTDLIEESTSSVGDLDYLQYQYDELEQANLNADEFEGIEEEVNGLEHAEEIKAKVGAAFALLSDDDGAVLDRLQSALSQLREVSGYNSDVAALVGRIESSRIELQDVARELEHTVDAVEFDPERIAELYLRQNTVNKLLAKHQLATVNDLLKLQDELETKLRSYDSIKEEIVQLEQALAKLEKEVQAIGSQLFDSRSNALPGIEQAVADKLAYVGMPGADFRIVLERLPLVKAHSNGMDKVAFLFSANKGMKPEDLKRVASGGELSRLMLVLKSLIAANTALPTLIFDEIDTGISGEVAAKVGQVMEQLGTHHQVISITHLPQIASKGNSHLFVYKEEKDDKTVTNIRVLTPEERTNEIAKMLGGDGVSQAAINNARELLTTK